MNASSAFSGLSLVVALIAFGLTGALAIRARVEPFYAVLRSIVAFVGVLCLARWSASVVETLGPANPPPDRNDHSGGSDAHTRDQR